MIFQKIVLDSFRKLRRGALEVLLPGGTRLHFGGLFRGLKAEIRVLDANLWKRCVLFGPIGFAESYMAGEWETPDLVHVIAFFIWNSEDSAALQAAGRSKSGPFDLLGIYNKLRHRSRPNSLKNSKRNIRDHYDLSNDFFRIWLDESMTYSGAFFDPPTLSLAEAQTRKYQQLVEKLHLRPNDHLLEIGCGWGGMSIHAAKTVGCRVTAVTISEEQFREASERVHAAGLGERVEIQLQDYRLIQGQFDKIVSIEMIEAVGDKFLDGFFAQCSDLLRPQGLLALQMITCPDQQFAILRDGVDFIQKHIFPGSLLVSQRRVSEATFRSGDLNLLDWEDWGMHYAKTLALWREKFEEGIDAIRDLGFDEEFLRKWRYYLSYCEAGFGSRHISVVQAVFTRPNNHSIPSPVYQLFEAP